MSSAKPFTVLGADRHVLVDFAIVDLFQEEYCEGLV